MKSRSFLHVCLAVGALALSSADVRAADAQILIKGSVDDQDAGQCNQTGDWLYCYPLDGRTPYKVAHDAGPASAPVILQPDAPTQQASRDSTRPYNNSGTYGSAVPANVGAVTLNPASVNPITLQAAPEGYGWACDYGPYGYGHDPRACWLVRNPTLLDFGVALGALWATKQALGLHFNHW